MSKATETPTRAESLRPFDRRFYEAMLALMELYDLVDADRDLLVDEIDYQLDHWIDVVGADLARLEDRPAVEEALAEALGID